MNNTSLMEQLFHVEAMLRRYQSYHFRHIGGIATPQRGQGRVLLLLKLQPEISQKELGYLLDMRNQSLGELLSKLEKNGYIERTPSQQDRRTMNIKLTEEGLKAAEQADKNSDESDRLFDCLNDEEKEQLHSMLTKLTTAMEEGMENYGGERAFDTHRGHHHGRRGPMDFRHMHRDRCQRSRDGRFSFPCPADFDEPQDCQIRGGESYNTPN